MCDSDSLRSKALPFFCSIAPDKPKTRASVNNDSKTIKVSLLLIRREDSLTEFLRLSVEVYPHDSFQPCFYDVALVSVLLSGKSIFPFSLSLFHFFTSQANEDYDFEGKNGENGEEDCERFFTCISTSLSLPPSSRFLIMARENVAFICGK